MMVILNNTFFLSGELTISIIFLAQINKAMYTTNLYADNEKNLNEKNHATQNNHNAINFIEPLIKKY